MLKLLQTYKVCWQQAWGKSNFSGLCSVFNRGLKTLEHKYEETFFLCLTLSPKLTASLLSFQDCIQLVGRSFLAHHDRDRKNGNRGSSEAAAATNPARARCRHVGRSQRAAAADALKLKCQTWTENVCCSRERVVSEDEAAKFRAAAIFLSP